MKILRSCMGVIFGAIFAFSVLWSAFWLVILAVGIFTVEWEDMGDIWLTVKSLVPALVYCVAYYQITERLERNSQSGYRYQRGLTRYPENWEDLRQEVLERDEYQCGNCGSTDSLHVHHIVPLSLGGSNQPSNLRTLCKSCHKKLHPHMKD